MVRYSAQYRLRAEYAGRCKHERNEAKKKDRKEGGGGIESNIACSFEHNVVILGARECGPAVSR